MDIELYLTLIVISLPVFLLLDMLWLRLVFEPFILPRYQEIYKDINWFYHCFYYFVLCAGLSWFVIYPSVTRGTLMSIIILASLYGLFTQLSHNLVNQSTLNKWPLLVTIIDTTVRTMMMVTTGVSAFIIYAKFFNL